MIQTGEIYCHEKEWVKLVLEVNICNCVWESDKKWVLFLVCDKILKWWKKGFLLF